MYIVLPVTNNKRKGENDRRNNFMINIHENFVAKLGINLLYLYTGHQKTPAPRAFQKLVKHEAVCCSSKGNIATMATNIAFGAKQLHKTIAPKVKKKSDTSCHWCIVAFGASIRKRNLGRNRSPKKPIPLTYLCLVDFYLNSLDQSICSLKGCLVSFYYCPVYRNVCN